MLQRQKIRSSSTFSIPYLFSDNFPANQENSILFFALEYEQLPNVQELYLARVTGSLEILCQALCCNSWKYNFSHQVVQSQEITTQQQEK